MNLSDFSRTDRVLLFSIPVVLGVCVYLFFHSEKFFGGGFNGEPIGEIVPVGQEVRRKHAGRLDFQPLAAQTRAYDQDTVFAGPNSGAHIRLKDGSQIALGANTLVRLEKRLDEIGSLELKVLEGSVQVDTSKTTQESVQVAKGEKKFRVKKNSTAQFYGPPDQLHVKIHNPASVVTDDINQAINVNQEGLATLVAAAPRPPQLKLPLRESEPMQVVAAVPVPAEQPAPYVTLDKDDYRIVLTQKTQLDFAHDQFDIRSIVHFGVQSPELFPEVDFQIAFDPKFTDVVESFRGPGAPAEWLKARAGTYYLRARANRPGAIWSPAARIHIIYDRPKAILKEETIFARTEYSPSNYEFAVREVPSQTPVRRFVVHENRVNLSELPEGKYEIRVRALDRNAWPVSAYSHPVSFKRTLPKPVEPEIRPLASVAQPPEPKPEIVSSPQKATSIGTVNELKPKAKERYSLTAGGGFNFLKYSQSGTGSIDSSNFQSVGPTGMLGGRYSFSADWSVAGEYHHVPGKVASSTAPLDKDQYNWTTALVEFAYRLKSSPTMDWSVLAGVQSHEFPFMYQDQGGVLKLIENRMTNFSIGLRAASAREAKWSYETYLRYQQPVFSGTSSGELSVTPKFSLDGAVGVNRRIFERSRLGVYWLGQNHDIQYVHKSTDAAANSSGRQSMFNSNVQIRFTFSD